jgi:hypothetical protein
MAPIPTEFHHSTDADDDCGRSDDRMRSRRVAAGPVSLVLPTSDGQAILGQSEVDDMGRLSILSALALAITLVAAVPARRRSSRLQYVG